MATSEKNVEKACQTYDSLEGACADPELCLNRNEPLTQTLSSLKSVDIGDPIPDDTSPKEVVTSTHDEGQGQPEEARGTEVYLHHQCSHEETVIADGEEPVHPPKQEARSRLSSARSLETTDDEYLRGVHELSVGGGGDGSVFSSSLSSSLSSFAMCDRCSAAFASMTCSSSKEFWEGVGGSRFKCCERIWKNFEGKLMSTFPQESALHNKRVMILLKTLLGVTGELDVVPIDKFLRQVKFFGPFRSENERCVAIQQLEDLIRNSSSTDKRSKKKICWFAGPMSRDDAESKLNGKRPGTFLIRMSETEQESGSFVASLVMDDNSIEHFILQGHPEEAIRSTPFDLNLEFRGTRYSSLPKLVNEFLRKEEICEEGSENATRCAFVCDNLPFNQVINGYAK